MPVDGLAHVPVTIDVTGQSQEQTDLQVKSICKQLLKEWANVQDSDIMLSRISGGLSNALYKVAPPPPLNSISFRIYGPGTEVFVHRDTELKLMQLLHSQGIGPALHGTFTNGRLEEYLHMRCLEPEEMATSDNIIAQIAKKLAQLHSTPGADAVFGPSSQATKTPFAKTREWLAIAEKLDFTTTSSITDAEIAKKKAEKLATFDFKEMNRQVDLVEAIATTKLNSPIVLAHCDLLAGNIMYNQPPSNGSNDNINGNNIVGAAINLLGSSGGNNCSNDNINGSSKDDAEVMTFIDFEYSGWAPRGFDFGNHFCEYAGFDCDYSRYPDERAASKFLKTYLEETKAMMMMGQSGNNNKNNKNGIEVVTVGDDEVRAAVREANVYALSSHMFWGAWAFLQAAWSDIDFDYLEYAGLRWGEYYKRRDEFLGAVGE